MAYNNYYTTLEINDFFPQISSQLCTAPKYLQCTYINDDLYQILYSLKVTFVLISHHGGAGKESPKPLRFLERIEKPVPRPPTPIVPCPSPGSEEEELAIVLLQRVIRGRAIQTKVRNSTNTISIFAVNNNIIKMANNIQNFRSGGLFSFQHKNVQSIIM